MGGLGMLQGVSQAEQHAQRRVPLRTRFQLTIYGPQSTFCYF